MLVLFGYSATCQDDQLFRKLNIDNALYYNPITAINQDARGLLWIGTQSDGLHYYNGHSFKSLRNLPEDSSSVPSNHITSIYFDRNETVWVTANTSVIAELDSTFSTFKRYTLEKPDRSVVFETVAQANNQVYFVGSRASGLFYIDTNNGKIKNYVHHRDTLEAKHLKGVGALVKNGTTLYIGAKGAVYFLKDSLIERLLVIPDVQDERPIVNGIISVNDQYFWISTIEHGLFQARWNFQFTRWDFVHYSKENGLLPSNKVTSIIYGRDDRLWVLTEEKIAILSSPDYLNSQLIENNNSIDGSLRDNRCYSGFQSSTGTIFIGTYSGLNYLDQFRVPFRNIRANQVGALTLPDPYVSVMHEDINKNVWIAYKSHKVSIFSLSEGKMEVMNTPSLPEFATSLNKAGAFADHFDTTKIWIGTKDGLFSIDLRDTNKIEYDLSSPRIIRSLYFDKEKRILLVGTDLHLFLRDEFGKYRKVDQNIKQIRSIIKDSMGYYWICANYTLLRLSPDFSRYQTIADILPQLTFLKNILILTVKEINNEIWIGTLNKGIIRIPINELHRPLPKYKQYTSKDGLVNNSVYSFLEDKNGFIWMSTNNGLSKFHPEYSYFLNYGTSDGIVNTEYNINSYIKHSSGFLIFGGINGLTYFDPLKIKNNPYLPIPKFSQIDIFPNSEDQKFREISLYHKNMISLSYLENSMTFHLYTNQLTAPKETKYLYQLSPVGNNWVPIEGNKITLLSLEPGVYTIRVRASTGGHLYSLDCATLTIIISPPFWKQAWVVNLFLVFITSIIFLGIYLYIATQSKKKKVLEGLIQQRTLELSEKNSYIQSQNVKLQETFDKLLAANERKDEILSILSHDLRSPLTTLKGFLNLLTISIETQNSSELVPLIKKIESSVSSSLQLTDNILYWAQSQGEGLKWQTEWIEFTEILHRAINLHALSAEKKSILIKTNYPSSIRIFGDENVVFMIVRNIISNAIKFSYEKSTIEVNSWEAENEICFEVKDEGIGFDPEALENILKKDKIKVTRGTHNEKGTGLGLQLIHSYIENMNGSISFSSEKGKGSTILIKFPKEFTP